VAEEQEQESTSARGKGTRNALIIVGVVLALFAIIVVKALSNTGGLRSGVAGSATSAERVQGAARSLTSVHNDASSDYAAALQTGKPIYVLFHSLTCQPCVEISGVADKVVPAYRDRIVFVNAITDDASAQRLASRFAFEYIPTSFFLRPDGSVESSFTGVLSDAEMKARLDELAAR
jgi:thioredoxin-like negative regulator of GroEL